MPSIASVNSNERCLISVDKFRVVESVALLGHTVELQESDLVGSLEEAGNPERLNETLGGSPDFRNYWKSLLESFLDANYGDPDLRFGDIMRKFRFSRTYGCKLFKQHLGKPFLEKLREIRIARAVPMITETTMYMNEIAAECGFRSPNRFCEAFKRINGISPVEYRKRNFKRNLLGK